MLVKILKPHSAQPQQQQQRINIFNRDQNIYKILTKKKKNRKR